MSGAWEEFWSTLPEKVLHPVRVPIIEALWWIGEPLSAIALVDALDGFLSMWEAAHHLRVLDEFNVVEPSSVDTDRGASREDLFEVPHRLKDRNSGEGA
jgi:Helix-turn-helix domain